MILKCSKGHSRSLRPGLGKTPHLCKPYMPRCWGCGGWTGELVWLDLSNLFQYGAIDVLGPVDEQVKDQWIHSPWIFWGVKVFQKYFKIRSLAGPRILPWWGCTRAVRALRFKLTGWLYKEIIFPHKIQPQEMVSGSCFCQYKCSRQMPFAQKCSSSGVGPNSFTSSDALL